MHMWERFSQKNKNKPPAVFSCFLPGQESKLRRRWHEFVPVSRWYQTVTVHRMRTVLGCFQGNPKSLSPLLFSLFCLWFWLFLQRWKDHFNLLVLWSLLSLVHSLIAPSLLRFYLKTQKHRQEGGHQEGDPFLSSSLIVPPQWGGDTFFPHPTQTGDTNTETNLAVFIWSW